jgi:hypothetical protein
MNPWSHLPNAAHIDRILADVSARPLAWDSASSAMYRGFFHITVDDLDRVRRQVSSSILDKIERPRLRIIDRSQDLVADAYELHREAHVSSDESGKYHKGELLCYSVAWSMAWHAVKILIARDHAGGFLNMSVEELQVLHVLGEDPLIVLLLPVVHVLESSVIGTE